MFNFATVRYDTKALHNHHPFTHNHHPPPVVPLIFLPHFSNIQDITVNYLLFISNSTSRFLKRQCPRSNPQVCLSMHIIFSQSSQTALRITDIFENESSQVYQHDNRVPTTKQSPQTITHLPSPISHPQASVLCITSWCYNSPSLQTRIFDMTIGVSFN